MIGKLGMKSGKLAESVLKRSVLRQIHGEKQGVGSDCAFFSVPNGQILAWCAQEAAVAVQADAGEAATLVQKAANNLAVGGAKPVSAQIALMLPEGTQEALVKVIMAEVAEACEANSMTISGGDTNVTSAVNVPILTVTAMGVLEESKKRDLSLARAGQDIVATKWIGLEGTAILARMHRERLMQRFPAYLVEEAAGFDRYLSVLPEAEIALQNQVCAMHDLSQGGIFGGLWELAEGAGLGLDVELKRIPIRQETVEVCEVCGVNPYEMRSSGCLLMTARDGEALVQALESKGISACVIGRLTDGQDRMIRNEEEIRYLDRPRGGDPIWESRKD